MSGQERNTKDRKNSSFWNEMSKKEKTETQVSGITCKIDYTDRIDLPGGYETPGVLVFLENQWRDMLRRAGPLGSTRRRPRRPTYVTWKRKRENRDYTSSRDASFSDANFSLGDAPMNSRVAQSLGRRDVCRLRRRGRRPKDVFRFSVRRKIAPRVIACNTK